MDQHEARPLPGPRFVSPGQKPIGRVLAIDLGGRDGATVETLSIRCGLFGHRLVTRCRVKGSSAVQWDHVRPLAGRSGPAVVAERSSTTAAPPAHTGAAMEPWTKTGKTSPPRHAMQAPAYDGAMECSHEDREDPRNCGPALTRWCRRWSPGHETRKTRVQPLSGAPLEQAAKEPGHEDREDPIRMPLPGSGQRAAIELSFYTQLAHVRPLVEQ